MQRVPCQLLRGIPIHRRSEQAAAKHHHEAAPALPVPIIVPILIDEDRDDARDKDGMQKSWLQVQA